LPTRREGLRVSDYSKSPASSWKLKKPQVADHSLADDDVIQEMDLKYLRSRGDALGEL
jgi:hypothetical protein